MQELRRYNVVGDKSENDLEVGIAAGYDAGWRFVEKGPASLHFAEERQLWRKLAH